ncbi:MAG: AraC family transcriptional regulator, partial [Tannerella sp.]|nr:AraC family transcriptional regulator [Tannerella sp.]
MEKHYTGDPSEIIQSFPKLNMQILCCRYWWIKHWEHRELSFPYWRIYNNAQQGAFMEYNQQCYDMKPDILYLIAPNTNYSSRIHNYPTPREGYKLQGGRISEITDKTREELISRGAIEHLFIHFTLGYPYDHVAPGIYSFKMDESRENKIIQIREYLTKNVAQFNFTVFLTIQSLIYELLFQMGEKKWKYPIRDVRIAKVISFIENNIGKEFSNTSLADLAHMSTNAFACLFKEETGATVQNFIKSKRIHAACLLLLHTHQSIDEVAEKTGFANRYHFTRIFSRVTGITPGKYKKADLFTL